jgi:hypothetical protein
MNKKCNNENRKDCKVEEFPYKGYPVMPKKTDEMFIVVLALEMLVLIVILQTYQYLVILPLIVMFLFYHYL